MFEFELKGGMEELVQLERELLQHLGFKTPSGDTEYPRDKYVNIAEKYGGYLPQKEKSCIAKMLAAVQGSREGSANT